MEKLRRSGGVFGAVGGKNHEAGRVFTRLCRSKGCGKHGRAVDRVRRGLLWILLSLCVCFAGPDLLEFFNGFNFSGYGGSTVRSVEAFVRSSDVVHRVFKEEVKAFGKPLIQKSVLSDPRWNVSDSLGVRIYIYDLPPKYNQDWLVNSRCSNHLFAAEVAIHRVLLNSSVRVLDPWQADYFFVPVYVSCNFSARNGFPAIGHARGLLASAVQLISHELPFWNRSKGADHVFVAAHDYGACFHAMEDVAIADGIPEFLQNSIILQTFGVKGRHRCQDVEHIQIPPYVPPPSILSLWPSAARKHKRDTFAFFRGKMEIHPKNISGRIYSKGVRTVIWQKFGRNRRFYLKRKRFEGYQAEILRSVFCLCPLGWAPWSPRIVESVTLGCVPVIIADNISLPFANVVPWHRISLTVAERDVGKLSKILERVAATNLTSIQTNLWNDDIRRALLFTEPLERGDATWHILSDLAKRLRGSNRTTELGSFSTWQ